MKQLDHRFAAIAAPLVLTLPISAQTTPDITHVDFEGGPLPIFLATFDGTKPAASLELTEDPAHVHDGQRALEFSLDRLNGSPPAIVHNDLLTDLVSFRHWAQSELDATWVVMHVDRDGAVFYATVDLPAGQWVPVDLSPGDFLLEPGSPVFKPSMEPERNASGWVGFDLASITGPPGPNRVWIDEVEVDRGAVQFIAGPVVLLSSTELVVHQPTWIDGDLIVFRGARFESDASRLVIGGDIVVGNAGSEVTIREGSLRRDQSYAHQRTCLAMGGGRLRFADLHFAVSGMSGLLAREGGIGEVERCSFAGGSFTAIVEDGGTVLLRDSDSPGEFLVRRDGILLAENLEGILVWLMADEGLDAEVTGLKSGAIRRWSLDPTWNRRVELSSIDAGLFGLIVESGCELTARDCDFRAVGVLFDRGSVLLDGYTNGDAFADHTFSWPDRSARFVNVAIESWNFYAAGTSSLSVRDSLFGELLAFDQGTAHVSGSVCDGTGGYFGVEGDGFVTVTDSDILCPITNHDDSVMRMKRGTVTGTVTAAGSATIGFQDCDLQGPLVELENGRIIVR